jgi:hypothetical protein
LTVICPGCGYLKNQCRCRPELRCPCSGRLQVTHRLFGFEPALRTIYIASCYVCDRESEDRDTEEAALEDFQKRHLTRS